MSCPPPCTLYYLCDLVAHVLLLSKATANYILLIKLLKQCEDACDIDLPVS